MWKPEILHVPRDICNARLVISMLRTKILAIHTLAKVKLPPMSLVRYGDNDERTAETGSWTFRNWSSEHPLTSEHTGATPIPMTASGVQPGRPRPRTVLASEPLRSRVQSVPLRWRYLKESRHYLCLFASRGFDLSQCHAVLGVTNYVLDRVHFEHVCFLSYRDVFMQSGTYGRHMPGYYGRKFSCRSLEPPESHPLHADLQLPYRQRKGRLFHESKPFLIGK